ncbi:hypothetical protein K439DRAFT_1023127 [Ramaria rubella]|nr:hypothetical protein K439DRAFT_1023127 [Ramaria rubella]
MHSQCRNSALRAWTLASPKCRRRFNTQTPARDEQDFKPKIIPYQSMGWVSTDFRKMARQPWMQVPKKDGVRADREKEQSEEGEQEQELHDVLNSQKSYGLKNAPLANPAPPIEVARQEPEFTAAAIGLSSSGNPLRRKLGRDLLPQIPGTVPEPASRTDYFLNERPTQTFMPRPYRPPDASSSPPSPPLELLETNRIDLDQFFEVSESLELGMVPEVGVETYGRKRTRQRKASKNVSAAPMLLSPVQYAQEALGGLTTDNEVYGDTMELDPSRIPDMKPLPQLPQSANLSTVPSRKAFIPQLQRASGRLWRDPLTIINSKRKP